MSPGTGTEKNVYIDREIDKISLSWMKNIKTLFNPNNLLNPGKVFP
jgi:D-lactate dehydrogenase